MSNYAFEGEIIKLNERDYNKWRKDFPHLLDFNYHLDMIDREIQVRMEQGEKKPKWFVETYKRMSIRDMHAKNKGEYMPINDRFYKKAKDTRSTRDIPIEDELNDTSWADGC